MNTRKLNKLLLGTAIVTLAIGVTNACKDFLNTQPQGVLDQNALATANGAEGLLIAAYRSLDCNNSSVGAWGCAASNWVWGSVTSGDAHKGSNLGDQAPVFEIETYLWSAGDVQDYLNQKWSQVYDGAARANASLRLLNRVVAAGGIGAAQANHVRGEALFLRAHYHFEAYRMWKNIPYYFENDTLDFKKSNVGVDVIGNLVKDLDTAEVLLAVTPFNGDAGRATKWTARAYKGRVYAYAAADVPAYWDSAKAVLDSITTGTGGSPYALETDFTHVWTAFTQFMNGPETILAYQASIRDGEPNGENSNFGERLNFPHSGSHFGCCGFHQPTFNLVNFYAVDANGLPLAETNPAWNDPAPQPANLIPVSDTGQIWKGLNFIGGTQTPIDPRLDWTVGRDRTPYKDWGLPNRSWIRDASYSGPYSPKKNVQENAANGENNVGWVTTQTNDVNIHLFRYADALLLLAEADVMTGNLEAARTIVNQIRARAGQVAQGCGQGFDAASDSVLKVTWSSCVADSRMAVPLVQNATLDSVSTQWATYRIGLYPGPWTVAATALQAVKFERRLELAMEGQHFFDLRRWGDADTSLANYIAIEKNRIPYLSGISFAARNHLYPIPAIQIELSKVGSTDMLVQNTGW